MACKQTEYGRMVTIYHTDEPTVEALRRLVRNYDEGMEALGLDPIEHQREATLVSHHNGRYGTAGWYLKLHAESCCYG